MVQESPVVPDGSYSFRRVDDTPVRSPFLFSCTITCGFVWHHTSRFTEAVGEEWWGIGISAEGSTEPTRPRPFSPKQPAGGAIILSHTSHVY